MSITLDTQKFNAMLGEIEGATGKAMAQIVAEESTKFVETCFNITPPGLGDKGRITGENKIRADADRLFVSLDDTMDAAKSFEVQNAQLLWFNKDGKGFGVEKANYRPQGTSADAEKVMDANSSWKHGRARIRTHKPHTIKFGRGQEMRVSQKFAFPKQAVDDLVTRKQAHVGRLKAGWLPSLLPLMASPLSKYKIRRAIPEWVKRHASGARGRFENNLQTPDHPSVTVTNYGAGIERAEPIIQGAFTIRLKAMAANVALYIKGIKRRVG